MTRDLSTNCSIFGQGRSRWRQKPKRQILTLDYEGRLQPTWIHASARPQL